MTPGTYNIVYLHTSKTRIDQSIKKINMAIPQSIFLLENDFLEIDVPFDEMTMR